MSPTIANLFDPRGGHSVIADRCEVCNEPTDGFQLCDTCATMEEEDGEGFGD